MPVSTSTVGNPSTVSFGMRAMLTYRSRLTWRTPDHPETLAVVETLAAERKQQAAEAFWQDENAAVEQAEAIAVIAQRIKFRMKSVQALPIEKKARHLMALGKVSEMVAARLLVAFHLAHQRPMMASFLDALGIAHEDGLIADDELRRRQPTSCAKRQAPSARPIPRRRRALSVDADLAGPRDLGCLSPTRPRRALARVKAADDVGWFAFALGWTSSAEGWIALATLTILEIVLGIDNIVFISILAASCARRSSGRARRSACRWR